MILNANCQYWSPYVISQGLKIRTFRVSEHVAVPLKVRIIEDTCLFYTFAIRVFNIHFTPEFFIN